MSDDDETMPSSKRSSPRPKRDETLRTMALWVTAIADNIKNPVAGIAAALDILERQFHGCSSNGACESAEVAATMHMIRQRLARLNTYVTELVDFTKPPVLQMQRVKLSDLLQEVVSGFAEHGGLTLPLVLLPDPADTMINCDPTKLKLALTALAINGVEAVPPEREPCLFIKAIPGKAHELNGRSEGILITIADNGPGIPLAIQQRVIEPFFSTKEAGTGLGLALASKYVKAHGGSLSIGRSRELGGCEIALFIPSSNGNSQPDGSSHT